MPVKNVYNIHEQIARLNATVWCRLGQSQIHGVGVIAIRDIPAGTPLYPSDDYVYELSPSTMTVHGLLPAIRKIVMDRRQMNGYFRFPSPNRDADMQCFMNHSKDPNSNGHSALRDIKADEEVTESYTQWGGVNEELQKCV